MAPQEHAAAEGSAYQRLKILMLARVLIVTLLLGVSALMEMSKGNSLLIPSNNALYALMGFTCLLSILYALTLRRIRDLRRFAYVQIFLDVVFITLLVYLTGGIESLFPLAYVLSIIGAGLVLSRQGTYVIACLSGVLYAGSLSLEYYGVIHPFTDGGPHLYSGQDILYRIFIYFLAFFVVAALVNHLEEELRTKGKELRQKQLEYDKLEAFHESVVQSLDSGLMTTDRTGRTSFLNRTAYRILGIDPLGEALMDLDARLSSLKASLPLDTVKWEDVSGREETTFRRPDGEIIHLGLSRSPLRDMNGNLFGSILIFQNITRIKEMEDQIQRADRMVSIGQMAAGIAHEIRNPLASLMGSIQMLKEETDLSQDNLNLMNIVLRESERLNKLVTDFLLFAHPPKVEISPVPLNRIIDETLELLKNSPQFNGHVTIAKDLADAATIPGDSNQLKQVFWNLFLNAVQEMDGGGTLGVRVEKGEGTVKLTVSDTGRGMDHATRGKIFEPFFTTRESGTGLGLAIVHRIVEAHGGQIRVDSEPGKGTCFVLLFPVSCHESQNETPIMRERKTRR